MDYPLLHKGTSVLVGLCFLISDTEILEGECGFFYINSDGVIDPSTAKLVKATLYRKRKRSKSS
jgi:hypothetical protein